MFNALLLMSNWNQFIKKYSASYIIGAFSGLDYQLD